MRQRIRTSCILLVGLLNDAFYRFMKRHLSFLLAQVQIPIEWRQSSTQADSEAPDEMPEDLVECLSNARLSAHFREFGKELGVAEAKSLEDVYKSHLENTSTLSTFPYQNFI